MDLNKQFGIPSIRKPPALEELQNWCYRKLPMIRDSEMESEPLERSLALMAYLSPGTC